MGPWRTEIPMDLWILAVAFYAARVAHHLGTAVGSRDGGQSSSGRRRGWPTVRFLVVSSLATMALAIVAAAIAPDRSLECAILVGFTCQVVAFSALFTLLFVVNGDEPFLGLWSVRSAAGAAWVLGLSLLGTAVVSLERVSVGLGAALLATLPLGWAIHNVGRLH